MANLVDKSNIIRKLIYSIDGEDLPRDITYGEWTARWWKWAFTVPREVIQYGDDTGRNCSKNQGDEVWFLAGTTGREAVIRKCAIPHGRSILFPVVNAECSFSGEGYRTESELRTCAKSYMDKPMQMEASIDGVKLNEFDLRKNRVQSPLFELYIPDNNFFGLQEAETQAVSDGYWVFLRPLPSFSKHEIHIIADDLIFRSEVTYTIIIE